MVPELFPFHPRKAKAYRAEGTQPSLIRFCTSAPSLYGGPRVHSKKNLSLFLVTKYRIIRKNNLK